MDGAGYRMRVRKDEILGYLTERSEHEVIIEPDKIEKVPADELEKLAPRDNVRLRER